MSIEFSFVSKMRKTIEGTMKISLEWSQLSVSRLLFNLTGVFETSLEKASMRRGVYSDISVNETTPIAIRDSTSVRGIKMHPQLLSSVRPYSALSKHIPATVVRNDECFTFENSWPLNATNFPRLFIRDITTDYFYTFYCSSLGSYSIKCR